VSRLTWKRRPVWELLVLVQSVADGNRRVPAAILLAEDFSTALQPVPAVTLKRHRLPRSGDKSLTISLPSILYIWIYADSHWKWWCAKVTCKNSGNKTKKTTKPQAVKVARKPTWHLRKSLQSHLHHRRVWS